jgi:DNA gyrase subunit A
MVVTITNSGYVKRLPQDTFKQQRRGGRGVMGMETKEEDFVEHLFVASTHDYFLFFTDQGRMHKLKVYGIPLAGRYARGKAVVNLLELKDDERVTAVIAVKEFDDMQFLMMATDRGIVKKVRLSKFASSYKSLRAINLDEAEVLVDVKLTDGNQEIIMATRMGKAIRFSEKDVRSMGRTARGVIGIRLLEGDIVIAMDVIRRDAAVLTITENGYGKRTPVEGYSVIHRGGQGVINIKTGGRNGVVVGIKEVSEGDEMLITSLQGIVIRVPVKDISVLGRNTQGVRIMRMEEGDKVVALARVVEEDTV